MILVLGAGGTVGSQVVERLRDRKAPFRAAFHNPEKAGAARARGIDAVTLDLSRPETLGGPLKGVDTLFLLALSGLDQARQELNALDAAKAAGVRRVVKLSCWKADEEAFEFARLHRGLEKEVEASGLAWTFLRPNGFMQNVVTYMGDTIRKESSIYSAVGGTKISHVDVRDIASVAARALAEPGLEGKTCLLSGPEALSYDDLAGELSRVLGRTIRHVRISPADLKAALVATGAPEEYADWLVDLDRYYAEGRARQISGAVKQLTGRDPLPFARFARECAPRLKA